MDRELLINYTKKYVDDILYFYSPKNIVNGFKKNVLLDG